jgi:hypothetical protein
MRVAIMQPYLFPYTPYFQLIHAVDCFVIFDTVQYIRRGWMHRNRIKLNGRQHSITFPTAAAPRDTPIREIVFAENAAKERERLLVTLAHAYGKAAHWNQLERLVVPLIAGLEPGGSFVEFAQRGLFSISSALGITTRFVRASDLVVHRSPQYENYVLDICQALDANEYVNAPGGRDLYRADVFAERGVVLRFLHSEMPSYSQPGGEFVPDLSVIDVLANLKLEDVRKHLQQWRLD